MYYTCMFKSRQWLQQFNMHNLQNSLCFVFWVFFFYITNLLICVFYSLVFSITRFDQKKNSVGNNAAECYQNTKNFDWELNNIDLFSTIKIRKLFSSKIFRLIENAIFTLNKNNTQSDSLFFLLQINKTRSYFQKTKFKKNTTRKFNCTETDVQ